MCRQARVLGRIITLHDEGLDLEADPALIEDAIATMGISGGRPVCTPAVHRDFFEPMSQDELTRVRLKGEPSKINKNYQPDKFLHYQEFLSRMYQLVQVC